MKKKINLNCSRKKLKMTFLLPNQTVISQFFSMKPKLDHVSTVEDNEDEVIVTHRQRKHRVVVDEEDDDEEVKLMAADNLDDDEVVVSDQVEIMDQAKKYKYKDTAFYQLINSFLQKSSNTSVRLPKNIHMQAIAYKD